MKECVNRDCVTGGMNLECLILTPAFVDKRSRQVQSTSRGYAEQKQIKNPFFSSGDLMLLKMAGAAAFLFFISLFC